MVQNISLILLGFIIGIGFMLIFFRDAEEEIEMIPPQPLFREEKNIVTIHTEMEIPEEKIYGPADGYVFVEKMLKHNLSNEIWKYAIVTREVDRKWMMHRYRADVQVVDLGRLNPFLEVDNGKT